MNSWPMTIKGDHVIECNESFVVNLSNPDQRHHRGRASHRDHHLRRGMPVRKEN